MGALFKHNMLGIIKLCLLLFMLFFHILYLAWSGMGIIIMLFFLGFVAVEIVRKFALKTPPEDIPALEKYTTYLGIPFALLLVLSYGRFIVNGLFLFMTILWFFVILGLEWYAIAKKAECKNPKVTEFLRLLSNIFVRVGLVFAFLICTATLASTDFSRATTMDEIRRIAERPRNIATAFGSLAYVFFALSMIVKAVTIIIAIVDNKDAINAYIEKKKAEAATIEEKNNQAKAAKVAAAAAAAAAIVATQESQSTPTSEPASEEQASTAENNAPVKEEPKAQPSSNDDALAEAKLDDEDSIVEAVEADIVEEKIAPEEE